MMSANMSANGQDNNVVRALLYLDYVGGKIESGAIDQGFVGQITIPVKPAREDYDSGRVLEKTRQAFSRAQKLALEDSRVQQQYPGAAVAAEYFSSHRVRYECRH